MLTAPRAANTHSRPSRPLCASAVLLTVPREKKDGSRRYDTSKSGARHAPPMRDRLYDEALEMSINKNLLDVTTLLEWANGAPTPLEKARHVDRAIELLRDIRNQLAHLGAPPPR